MGDDVLRTLTLEIDPSADPISGRVWEGDGSREGFLGWLGLARALERVIDAPPPGETPSAEASAER